MSDIITEHEQLRKQARGASLITYEARELENIAATYPEEMREPFLWLAEFARDKCARNLDALEHKLKSLGLPTTAGTLSKIIRGRWRLNSKNEVCTPVMSLSSFLDMVEKLRTNPDLSEMADAVEFIATSTYGMISHYIDVRRSPSRLNKFGLIIGPTGAQKTASFKYYAGLPGNNRSCKWLEAPHRPKMSHFIANLGKAYGIPQNEGTSAKMARIQDNLSAKKCLIIDNVQRLYTDPSMRKMDVPTQEIFSWIQRMQDETGFTCILSATPEFYGEFLRGMSKGYFEQFEGRASGRHEFLILPQYAPMEDILAIAGKYGLEDAESHAGYLSKIARMPGRIRILFQALQTSKEEAVYQGQPFTIDHLRETLPESVVDQTLKEVA